MIWCITFWAEFWLALLEKPRPRRPAQPPSNVVSLDAYRIEHGRKSA